MNSMDDIKNNEPITRERISKEVIDILKKSFGPKFEESEKEAMNEETTIQSLGIDSLDYIEIIISLEGEYDGLEIPEKDAGQFKKFGDIVDYVYTFVSQKDT